ncbi:DEAD/DEAH box helicase family protein [Candidatus Uhrbacteria bacterium]|nr:DEAD/DEAH box helicase family protein [Candidatus Uhrbacteria bacterium]
MSLQHADIRRELAGRLESLLRSRANLPLTFWPFQVEALEATHRWLDDQGGTRRAYIEHATGLGKTVLFAAIASFCTGLRVLIIVPTKILVEQTVRALFPFTGGMLGHLSGLPEHQGS